VWNPLEFAMKTRRISALMQSKMLELYKTQHQIRRLRAQLKQLTEQEAELKEKLVPKFSDSVESQLFISGQTYTVKYRHVEMEVLDADAVTKFYAKMGKRVPYKAAEYDKLTVVKEKRAE
jgi:FixJ family two-component response regulator